MVPSAVATYEAESPESLGWRERVVDIELIPATMYLVSRSTHLDIRLSNIRPG
jgi:hypothetical protein